MTQNTTDIAKNTTDIAKRTITSKASQGEVDTGNADKYMTGETYINSDIKSIKDHHTVYLRYETLHATLDGATMPSKNIYKYQFNLQEFFQSNIVFLADIPQSTPTIMFYPNVENDGVSLRAERPFMENRMIYIFIQIKVHGGLITPINIQVSNLDPAHQMITEREIIDDCFFMHITRRTSNVTDANSSISISIP